MTDRGRGDLKIDINHQKLYAKPIKTAKPAERQGRKATGLTKIAGLHHENK